MNTSQAISVRRLLVCAFLFFACLAAGQQLRPADGQTHPELLVSTQWLSDHLADPKLVIIDVGMAGMGSMGGMSGDFASGHIPGARQLNDDQISSQAPPGTELLPDNQLKANLEAIGIGDDSRVIIYSTHWYPMASRLFFTLDYLGFKNAALLDGGMEAWTAEKRPVSTEAPKIMRGTLTIHPHPEIVARIDAVRQLVNGSDSGTVLLDARPHKRYTDGHLPGAMSFFWENNLVSKSNRVLKSPTALREAYAAAGVTPVKKIVSYCEVGLQASYAYFIARYLGYDAQMYDGSYNEWSKQKQPTVQGEKAR